MRLCHFNILIKSWYFIFCIYISLLARILICTFIKLIIISITSQYRSLAILLWTVLLTCHSFLECLSSSPILISFYWSLIKTLFLLRSNFNLSFHKFIQIITLRVFIIFLACKCKIF